MLGRLKKYLTRRKNKNEPKLYGSGYAIAGSLAGMAAGALAGFAGILAGPVLGLALLPALALYLYRSNDKNAELFARHNRYTSRLQEYEKKIGKLRVSPDVKEDYEWLRREYEFLRSRNFGVKEPRKPSYIYALEEIERGMVPRRKVEYVFQPGEKEPVMKITKESIPSLGVDKIVEVEGRLTEFPEPKKEGKLEKFVKKLYPRACQKLGTKKVAEIFRTCHPKASELL